MFEESRLWMSLKRNVSVCSGHELANALYSRMPHRWSGILVVVYFISGDIVAWYPDPDKSILPCGTIALDLCKSQFFPVMHAGKCHKNWFETTVQFLAKVDSWANIDPAASFLKGRVANSYHLTCLHFLLCKAVNSTP